MDIRVLGRWLFEKPDHVKRMEEIEKLNSEIDTIKEMIDQETARFLREVEQISNESKARCSEMLDAFGRDIDRIDGTASSVIKEAEVTLFVANVDSTVAANVQEAILLLAKAKHNHDAVIAPLIARRNNCCARLIELTNL